MTFAFPMLLGGLLLAGIPVLLHLIVRQQPRILSFPAFRFLVQKQKTNLRKLRLRHLLLLTLRIALIAAMCLALARPRLFYAGPGLSRERPLAAVMVFDTSASMDYRQGDVTRLDEAKKRALELLERMPAGSRILFVDSGDMTRTEATWLLSLDEARKQIGALKVRPANGPVTAALGPGLRKLAELSRAPGDATAQQLARLVCIFSDRTPACWDGAQVPALQELTDTIAPPYDGLQQAQAQLAGLQDLVKQVRDQLPTAGKDYSDGSLLEALGSLQQELRGLTPQDLPPGESLNRALVRARRLCRELWQQTEAGETVTPDEASDFRSRLRAGLQEMLRSTAGAQMLFVDVGIEEPIDLALLRLELPRNYKGEMRQAFGPGESWVLQALVQATGKDLRNTLLCQIDGKKLPPRAFEAAAGRQQLVPLIDAGALALEPGPHQVEVRFETASDALPFNNQGFLTLAIRDKQRVLVLADDPARASLLRKALETLGYNVDLETGHGKLELESYRAVYMVGLAAPSAELWQALNAFVRQGGGLAIVPPGDDLQFAAYNEGAAQKLMPGIIAEKVRVPEPGSSWDWRGDRGQYQHPFMQAFQAWKNDPNTDFIRYPRGAVQYWEVKPGDPRAVLVRYRDEAGRPAVLERAPEGGRGKVLLFTTPLDQREPAWNNYAANITSFYLALLWQSTRYLCGTEESARLNFLLGRDAIGLTLPPGPRLPSYTLAGPDLLEKVTVGEAGVVKLPSVNEPGNYLLEGGGSENGRRQPVASFSVNMPPDESDLHRLPARAVEALFGSGALITPDHHVELAQALPWSEPLDLFPALMVLLLLLLAIENLLANKFYRRQA